MKTKSPIGTVNIVAADLNPPYIEKIFLLSHIGTAHLMDYMHHAYGTQLIVLTNLWRIEIHRYNIDRPDRTFISQ